MFVVSCVLFDDCVSDDVVCVSDVFTAFVSDTLFVLCVCLF